MKALILIDIQNDFLPEGALAVSEGDEIIPVVNELLRKPMDLVLATKDWHPEHHGSFASTHEKKTGEVIELEGLEQVLWPDHCIQNTPGAEFPPSLETGKIQKIFYKGVDENIDSYSAFFDNGHKRSTGLSEFLKERGVREVYIAGLTTDFCVKYSVLDALKEGFHTYVIEDACRGVNLKSEDSKIALEEMKRAGATIITSNEIT